MNSFDIIIVLCDVWHWQGCNWLQSIKLICVNALFSCWFIIFYKYLHCIRVIYHDYIYYITYLGLMKRHLWVLQLLTPRDVCAPGRYFDNIVLNMLPSDFAMANLYSQLQGNSMLCNWLSSLRCLVVQWINHLPQVCWAGFRKASSKQHLVCNLDFDENDITYICICIDIYLNIS